MRPSVEAFSGLMIIFLGVMFFFYLPLSPVNAAGNAIFIGAGYLVIRRAYGKNKRAVPDTPKSKGKTVKPKSKKK